MTGRSGPLAGIRVIELGGIGPGPFCGMILSDLGADVIRIDRPSEAGATSAFPVLHRGRRSLAVDLKSPVGTDVVLGLVDTADALIEGFRPGVAERLGVGPDACLAHLRALEGLGFKAAGLHCGGFVPDQDFVQSFRRQYRREACPA